MAVYLILADYTVSDINQLSTLSIARSPNPEIAFIFVSSNPSN
jgi:hypothetical protein